LSGLSVGLSPASKRALQGRGRSLVDEQPPQLPYLLVGAELIIIGTELRTNDGKHCAPC